MFGIRKTHGTPLSSPLTKKVQEKLYDLTHPAPSDEQLAAEEELKAGPEKPVSLPDVADPNIQEATLREQQRKKKRKGAASTLLSTDTGPPATTAQTLLGAF